MPKSIRTDPAPSVASDLAQEAEPVLEALRERIATVVRHLGEEINRGVDLSKFLGLNAALGWSLYRVATAPDGLSAEPYMPTAPTLQRFLRAAAEKGVAADVIEKTEQAFTDFEALVSRHAPDRASFTSMIRDLGGVNSSSDDVKHKRAAYRAQRHFMGVHADAYLHMSMYGPAANANTMDNVSVKGWLGMQRVRSSTTLLSESGVRLKVAGLGPDHVPEPLDNDGSDQAGFSLLKRFCTHPLPEFRSFVEDGVMITQAFSSEMGRRNASTYYLGGITRNVPIAKERAGAYRTARSYISVPTGLFFRDLWMHQSLWPKMIPIVEVYYQRAGVNPDREVHDFERLPHSETIELMGLGVQAATSKEIPRYPELVCYIAEKLAWKIEEFRLFRCRVAYPVLGSLVRVVMPLEG